MTSDIYDSEGNRIGVMTVTGPILDLSDQETEDIRQSDLQTAKATVGKLRAMSAEASLRRMSRLLDEAEVRPERRVDSLEQLTFEERKLIQYSLQGGDSVNLPYAVAMVSKTRQKQGHGKHAVEVSMRRAAARLYNRGLATVEKRGDGLVWVSVSRDRLVSAIRRELSSRGGPGEPNFNLMKVPCEIQTSSEEGSEVPEKVTKRLPSPIAMPRRCSGERMRAVQLLHGVRMLERPDKVEINTLFETYNDETLQKIISLIDNRNGEVMGFEYSTRFNDLAKAAANLNKFDYALDKSLRDFSKAVFLTLTTDPNLTDEERARAKESKIAGLRRKLSDPHLRENERRKLTWALMEAEGPDYEISEIEFKVGAGTATAGDRQRLSKLLSERKEAELLKARLDDPSTGVRTRERMVQSLKKMRRWDYTHDPEGFANLWEANRSFAPAWNRFMSYLKKKNGGKRPKYLAAFEFTDSGLLHIHVLIFLEYLLPNDQISLEWRRCGQGEITYVYALRNVRNSAGKREWRWNSGARPQDAKGMSGGDYLKKYVRKCMLALMDSYTSPADTHSMYWALNKRMHTCSRSLMEGYTGQRVEPGEEESGPPTHSLFRIMSQEEAEGGGVDRIVYHRIRPGWKTGSDPPADPSEGVSA